MSKNEKIRHWIAGFFIILFVTYYANATLFEHAHIINGITIVHSHFHTKKHNSTPSGGHTSESVNLIAHFNNIQCLHNVFIEYNLTPYLKTRIINDITFLRTPLISLVEYYILRAPPVL